MIKELQRAAADDAGVASLADHPTLDQAIRRLPEKYRAAVVRCYLDGLTQEQAAEHFGWPSGTAPGRHCRARDVADSPLS